MGKLATAWLAEEMLESQHQRVDVPAHARTVTMASSRSDRRGSLLNGPSCPPSDPIRQATELNWSLCGFLLFCPSFFTFEFFNFVLISLWVFFFTFTSNASSATVLMTQILTKHIYIYRYRYIMHVFKIWQSKEHIFRGHGDSVDQLCWHPTNPDHLATASGDKTVRIWDSRSSKAAAVINTKGTHAVCVKFYSGHSSCMAQGEHVCVCMHAYICCVCVLDAITCN